MRKRFNSFRLLCLVTTAGFATAANAQTATASPDEPQSSSTGVADIIVTAQRRSERQIEVPISLSAVTAETLERTGVASVTTLGRLVPSFQYEDSLASSGARARVRGLGSPTFVSGVETSVSVVIDGVVTGPSGSGLSDLFDVERVEVLRGPQGTLFGKNATAGVVNITSARPTEQLSAGVTTRLSKADYGVVDDAWSTRVDAFVSGPLSENTQIRVAGFTNYDFNGTVEERFRGGTNYQRRHYGGRLSLHHESGPWEIALTASFIKIDDTCCAATFREILPAFRTVGNVPILIADAAKNGVTISPSNRISFASQSVTERSRTSHLTATIAYDFGDYTLKSITGHRHWHTRSTDDSDRTSIDIADATTAAIDMRVLSQELQLISPQSDKFNFVIGAYFYDQNIKDVFRIGGGFFTANPLNRVSTANSRIMVRDYALFGNATYNFTPEVQLIAGARILRELQEMSGFRVGNFYVGNRPAATVNTSDTNWTGKLGLRYAPSSSNNFFATVSRGYKGFGLNNVNNGPFYDPANSASPILKPETVWNYEIGAKNRLFDGKLELNVVLFNQIFKNFQTSALDSSSNTFSLRNAGSIRSRGVEVDATTAPWEGANISFGLGYVDAVFTDFRGAPCTAIQSATRTCPAGGQDLSGRGVDGNPKWMVSIVGRQTVPLSERQDGYIQAEFTGKTKIQYNSDLDPMLIQPGYHVVNLRVGMTLDKRFDAEFFVENVGNTLYTNRISPAPLFPGVSSQYLAPGRTFGVQLKGRL